ncbi:AMP-binding protein, partial [Dietzia cercidiphylli]|uniref:AMP-binding protein n=1 Tax=Dietzia cercidiphylli TaxID=498199 RepID=UPI003F7F426F
SERRWLVDEVNDTDVAVDSAATLAEMHAVAVGLHGDASALVFGERLLTYREFGSSVSRLARALIARGVGPEMTVAVAMRRSVEMVVAVHAVVVAGAAYVPVDPDHPADRIAHIVESAEPALILTTSGGGVESAQVEVWAVDSVDLSGFDDGPVSDRDRVRELRADHPAYVLFTSGSTGRPKGVVVPHAAITNQLAWMQHEYPLAAGDGGLFKTPATFDVSVWELFWPLQTGARLVIAEHNGHKDPAYLASLINKNHITI